MVLSGLLGSRSGFGARWLLAVLLSVAVGRAQQAEIAGTLPEHQLPGLQTLLDTASQRSPQLIAADFERVLAELRLDGADSSRLPNVGGNLSYAINQTAISSNTTSQTRDSGLFYSVGVTQPVFHWRALKNGTDSARLNLLVAQKSFDLAARELRVILRRAYLALVVEKARLRAVAEAVKLQKDEIAVTTEKKDRGTVSSAVLEGEKLRLREVELDYNRFAAEYEANRRRLSRLSGLKELPDDAIPSEIPRPNCSPDLVTAIAAAALRDGAKSTLEYEINDLRVRDAMLRHSIEKVRLYPKLYASAGFSLENSTNVNNDVVNQQGIQRRTVSLYAQWSIFDGFATRGAIREALATKRLQERRREVDAEAILQNIQIIERTLKLDAEQLALAEIRHALAVEGSKVVAKEVELGNLPQGDLDRARAAIFQAEVRNQESRANLLGRWGELVALAGFDVRASSPPNRHVREKK